MENKNMRIKSGSYGLVLLALAGFGIGSRAGAAFVLVDNFDGYVVGSDINGQGSWTANTIGGTVSTVVTNPGGAGNSLSLPAFQSSPGDPSNYVYNNSSNINIANGSTGTLFYQFRFQGAGILNSSHGIADRAPASGTDFAAFEVQVRNGNASLSQEYNDMYVRDGGSFEGLTSGVGGGSPELTSGAWYNFWLVADNTSDTFAIYIQSDQDSNFSTQTQMTSGGDALNFRNGTTSALNSFFAINAPTQAQALYFDNIHVDNSGSNLLNPIAVPEPSGLALMVMGFGGLIFVHRRKTGRR